MKKEDLISLLRQEIKSAKASLKEFAEPPSDMEPPITPEEPAISDIGGLMVAVIEAITAQGQEALEMAVGMFEEAGMLDAMCSTTQGTIGFREDLKRQIAEALNEIEDPEFGFGPDNPERIEWPKRNLGVEGEAAVYEALENAVHRAKMSGISKEELADLFADSVHASYEENA